MSKPEQGQSWQEREVRKKARKLIDPHNQILERFEAFKGTLEEPDENNRLAVHALRFASEPRFAACMKAATEAYDEAVTAVAKLLTTQQAIGDTVNTLIGEESIKGEVIEYLGSQGIAVAPDAKFHITYHD